MIITAAGEVKKTPKILSKLKKMQHELKSVEIYSDKLSDEVSVIIELDLSTLDLPKFKAEIKRLFDAAEKVKAAIKGGESLRRDVL